jgi:hypothetical protein
VLATRRSRERHAIGRVARETSVANCKCEHEREDAVDLPHGRGRQVAAAQLGDPHRDLFVGDVGELDVAPARHDMNAEHALIPASRRRLQVDFRREPARRPLPYCDPRAPRVAMYVPVVTAVVTVSSQCCASILRAK